MNKFELESVHVYQKVEVSAHVLVMKKLELESVHVYYLWRRWSQCTCISYEEVYLESVHVYYFWRSWNPCTCTRYEEVLVGVGAHVLVMKKLESVHVYYLWRNWSPCTCTSYEDVGVSAHILILNKSYNRKNREARVEGLVCGLQSPDYNIWSNRYIYYRTLFMLCTLNTE